MDEGTSVLDILKSPFLEKSIGTVCVVNRSQKQVTDKKSISDTNNKELTYLEDISDEIQGRHGVDVLIERLVQRLNEAIMENVPTIEKVIFRRIQSLSTELKDENDKDKGSKIYEGITQFIEEYKKLIKGNRKFYIDDLVGGSRIRNVLYIDFPKSLRDCQVSQWNKSKVSNRIKNTLGKQEKDFSIHKPFRSLLLEEIRQLLVPSIRCNTDVKDLLKEFVVEVLREFKLDKYSNLSAKIEEEMNKYIEKKYKYMEEIIEHVIKSEEREVKNIRPESNLFRDLQSSINIPKSEEIGGLLSSITSLARLCSLNSFYLFTIDKSVGLLNFLNTKFICKANNNNSILKDVSTHTKTESLDDIKMIERMVKEHFKKIQNNVLYNVPKLIQSTFIEDLLKGLNEALYVINKEDPDYLLNITPEEAKKIEMNKDELEELKDISEDLNKLKRRN